ncbi:hypothetical protein BU17DRAFT_92948 [Hysterangium stoloniferum]|nr:hypothetical protein BU17DRAFT_92948 [Hysterangium stoloniferum]
MRSKRRENPHKWPKVFGLWIISSIAANKKMFSVYVASLVKGIHSSDESPSDWLYQATLAPPGSPFTTDSSTESSSPDMPVVVVPAQQSLTPETGLNLNLLQVPQVRHADEANYARIAQFEPSLVLNQHFVQIGNEDAGTGTVMVVGNDNSASDVVLHSSRPAEADNVPEYSNVCNQVYRLSDSDHSHIYEAHPSSHSILQPYTSENYSMFHYDGTMPINRDPSQELVPSITSILDRMNQRREFRDSLEDSLSITDTEMFYFTSRLSAFPTSFSLETDIDSTQSEYPATRPTSLLTDAFPSSQALNSSILSSEAMLSFSQGTVHPLSFPKKRRAATSHKSQLLKSITILKDLKSKVAEWNTSRRNLIYSHKSHLEEGGLDAPLPPQSSSVFNVASSSRWFPSPGSESPPRCFESPLPLARHKPFDTAFSEPDNLGPRTCSGKPISSYNLGGAVLHEESGTVRLSGAVDEDVTLRPRANVQTLRDHRCEQMVAAATCQTLNMRLNIEYPTQTTPQNLEDDDINGYDESFEQEINSLQPLERGPSGDQPLLSNMTSENPLTSVRKAIPIPVVSEYEKGPKFLRRLGAKASGIFFRSRDKSGKCGWRVDESPSYPAAQPKLQIFTRLFRRSVKAPRLVARSHLENEGSLPLTGQNSESQVCVAISTSSPPGLL